MLLKPKSKIRSLAIALCVVLLAVISIRLFFKIRVNYIINSIIHSQKYLKKDSFFKNIIIADNSVILIGDSILEDLIFGEGSIYNFSIGGETTSSLINRVKHYNFPDNSTIFCMIGVNDFLMNVDESIIRENKNTLLDLLLNKSPNSSVIFLDVLPINSSGFFHDNEKINIEIIKHNLSFRKEMLDVLLYNVDHLSLHNLFLNPNNSLKRDLSMDGIHLNDSGLIILRNNIIKAIEK
tara:strand:- start:248 stop:958 length:711 start_codon:yes stop_codon:yes gene_type:complete